MSNDSERYALQRKVEDLDREVADLRRCVEALNGVIGEQRLVSFVAAALPNHNPPSQPVSVSSR